MKLGDLSDKELTKIASKIEFEHKHRANRKAAAKAIFAILKKHKLSVGEISELGLEKIPSTTRRKKSGSVKAKTARAKAGAKTKTDKRLKVAYKYKNPNGQDKWSGRGRTPKWVDAILENNNISITQFKINKRYMI